MNERTAEYLRGERERYEYLLACAKDAEHEGLAWETIVVRMTVEDFVTAAKEVLAAREVVKAAQHSHGDAPMAKWCGLCQAIAAYDQATGQPATAAQPPGVG